MFSGGGVFRYICIIIIAVLTGAVCPRSLKECPLNVIIGKIDTFVD